MIAAKLATRAPGLNAGAINHRGDIATIPPTLGEAAEMLSVSKKSVQTAKVVHRDGTPELVQLVAEGHAPPQTRPSRPDGFEGGSCSRRTTVRR